MKKEFEPVNRECEPTIEKPERNSMKKHRPRNPIYNACCLFLPWRFFNTYYGKENGEICISSYYASEHSNVFSRKVDCIELQKVIKIGFPAEFNLELQEPVKNGKYGKYISQELVFVLDGGIVVPWNVRAYTKKQVKELLETIIEEYPLEIGDKLGRTLGIKSKGQIKKS